ncbi:hypothetical protein GCM10011578_097850 [Streptomyces fuscichromogenes]|uniref:Uncharacterized protein n=1 Tax=Streptomyces fuscichromogenes TaxID=1324013 RepID=A0A917XP70_9ACTN|nr:hypothetical protein GCM10011578_097850 [Streptomyces fuscichromogenes]
MHPARSCPRLVVSADGRGVVCHAGARLLADVADVTGLTRAFTDTLRRLRPRGTIPAGSRSISASGSPTAARRFQTWSCCATRLDAQPTAAVIDSQSVKADVVGGADSRCFDGGKLVNGRYLEPARARPSCV